jgi:predicted nucleotidyltransferase
MSSLVDKLTKKGLASPPKHLANSIQYETYMGSIAYGVVGESSDIDIYGFSIPPKEMVFPHIAGYIQGFGKKPTKFEQYQQHHIKEEDKTYDLAIYSIVKYFQLCLDNNPNMLDSLFTPQRCVIHMSRIGEMVRSSRRMFLHKGSYFKFKGYSFSQLSKMQSQTRIGKRAEIVEKYEYDLKFGYHTVRLLGEAEMILEHGDLDLERNKEMLKAIRRGDLKKEDILAYASEKERYLDKLYTDSKLPHSPNESKIKALLLSCLEEYYSTLEGLHTEPDRYRNALLQIEEIVEKVRKGIN